MLCCADPKRAGRICTAMDRTFVPGPRGCKAKRGSSWTRRCLFWRSSQASRAETASRWQLAQQLMIGFLQSASSCASLLVGSTQLQFLIISRRCSIEFQPSSGLFQMLNLPQPEDWKVLRGGRVCLNWASVLRSLTRRMAMLRSRRRFSSSPSSQALQARPSRGELRATSYELRVSPEPKPWLSFGGGILYPDFSSYAWPESECPSEAPGSHVWSQVLAKMAEAQAQKSGTAIFGSAAPRAVVAVSPSHHSCFRFGRGAILVGEDRFLVLAGCGYLDLQDPARSFPLGHAVGMVTGSHQEADRAVLGLVREVQCVHDGVGHRSRRTASGWACDLRRLGLLRRVLCGFSRQVVSSGSDSCIPIHEWCQHKPFRDIGPTQSSACR